MTINIAKDITLMRRPGGDPVAARLEARGINAKDQSARNCYVAIIHDGQRYEATEFDFYAALNTARARLEPLGLIPMLAGACINLGMSGMARDMGRGLSGYILEAGVKPGGGEMTEIFSDKLIGELGTVAERNAFYEAWLAG